MIFYWGSSAIRKIKFLLRVRVDPRMNFKKFSFNSLYVALSHFFN